MSLNKGKAKAKPAMKKGGSKTATTAATAGIPKRAVMNRRKYNEAISGDTMSNYAMYRAGGKVKKYQAGKQVADSTAIYAQKTREALSAMSPKKPGSEEAYEKAKQNQMDYENRKNKTNFKLPKTAPRAVNKAGGTTRKYKSGGKVLAKAQMGKVVKSAVDVGKVLAKKVRDRKIFGNLSDDIVKDIKKSEPAPKVDKAEAALNRRNREYEKAVWDSYKKKGGTARKYKSGGSTFPDLTGDGKVTRADILKGRGVIKKGGTIKKKK